MPNPDCIFQTVAPSFFVLNQDSLPPDKPVCGTGRLTNDNRDAKIEGFPPARSPPRHVMQIATRLQIAESTMQ